MNASELTAALKAEALRLGFDLVGATAAVSNVDADRLDDWLADGCAAEMRYFADRRHAYRDVNAVLPDAKSVLMLGLNYRSAEPIAPATGQGSVSRYAWGADYHEIIRDKLRRLADFHSQLTPHAKTRAVVDTAPFHERRHAQLAGLGWIGKNSTLINPRFGSWFFIGALLTTEELTADAPFAEDRCGECRKCLDACPTGALTAPHRMDARRCLSYLTIESRGPIPGGFHSACGSRLFGCDACQDACPWNRETPTTVEPAFYPRSGMNPLSLAELNKIDDAEFRRRFKDTPLARAGLAGLLRNAEVVKKNQSNR